MSEYQYYEFRKIQSSLSDEAMQEMYDFSSRAEVSRTSASFTYNYGDFPVDPIEVLTQYFDALFLYGKLGKSPPRVPLPHFRHQLRSVSPVRVRRDYRHQAPGCESDCRSILPGREPLRLGRWGGNAGSRHRIVR
jgi:hypothetical protein